MPFTTLTGLTIKVPTRGTRNWDAVVLTDTWTPIANHRHEGSGDGNQIRTAGIEANAITGAKIRLANDEYLRARNAANNADLNLWKANASDVLEQGLDAANVSLVNTGVLRGRNAADSGYINLATLNGSDAIVFGAASTNYTLPGDLAGDVSLSADATHSIADGTNKLLRSHQQFIRLYGSSSGYVDLTSADTVGTPYTIKMPDAEGTAGQFLSIATVGSNVVDLEFAAAPALANQDVSAKSADYTITDSDDVRTVLVTTSSTDRTITLPTAADNTNREIIVKKDDSGTGTVIIDPGSGLIDGATTYTLYNQYAWIKIVCDGTNWSIIAQGADIGTFTPTIGPANGSFASVTYVSQQGNYEIVGNRLFFDVAVFWSACSVGSASGDLRVQGLPFPSAATTDVIVNCQLQNINTTTGTVSVSGNILENSPPSATAVAEIGQTIDSGTLARVQAGEAAVGSFNKFIHLSGSYPI